MRALLGQTGYRGRRLARIYHRCAFRPSGVFMVRLFAFILPLVVCLVDVAAAQTALSAANPGAPVAPQSVVREPGGVTVRAIRLTEPLHLDGQLDEAVYRDNKPIDRFTQQEPSELQPATEPTDAWIMFDKDTLYIAARNWDSHPERMVLNELRHDSSNIIQNEQLTVILDTF